MAHLRGEKPDGSDVIGIYPLFPDGTCRFLVFDFDNHEKGAEALDLGNTDNRLDGKKWMRCVGVHARMVFPAWWAFPGLALADICGSSLIVPWKRTDSTLFGMASVWKKAQKR